MDRLTHLTVQYLLYADDKHKVRYEVVLCARLDKSQVCI